MRAKPGNYFKRYIIMVVLHYQSTLIYCCALYRYQYDTVISEENLIDWHTREKRQ